MHIINENMTIYKTFFFFIHFSLSWSLVNEILQHTRKIFSHKFMSYLILFLSTNKIKYFLPMFYFLHVIIFQAWEIAYTYFCNIWHYLKRFLNMQQLISVKVIKSSHSWTIVINYSSGKFLSNFWLSQIFFPLFWTKIDYTFDLGVNWAEVLHK